MLSALLISLYCPIPWPFSSPLSHQGLSPSHVFTFLSLNHHRWLFLLPLLLWYLYFVPFVAVLGFLWSSFHTALTVLIHSWPIPELVQQLYPSKKKKKKPTWKYFPLYLFSFPSLPPVVSPLTLTVPLVSWWQVIFFLFLYLLVGGKSFLDLFLLFLYAFNYRCHSWQLINLLPLSWDSFPSSNPVPPFFMF